LAPKPQKYREIDKNSLLTLPYYPLMLSFRQNIVHLTVVMPISRPQYYFGLPAGHINLHVWEEWDFWVFLKFYKSSLISALHYPHTALFPDLVSLVDPLLDVFSEWLFVIDEHIIEMFHVHPR